MTQYFFKVDNPFTWKKKKYERGYYQTENVDFIRSAQSFITLIEKEEEKIYFNFDNFEDTKKIEIEDGHQVITVDLKNPENITVDTEKKEDSPVLLEELENEIKDVFDVEGAEMKNIKSKPLEEGTIIKAGLDGIIKKIENKQLEEELEKFEENIKEEEPEETLQDTIPEN